MKKTFEGKVVSAKMTNTVVVEVTRKTPHPLYRKLIKRSKTYLADTNGKTVFVGDTVKIVETRPLTKNKHFLVSEIVDGKEQK